MESQLGPLQKFMKVIQTQLPICENCQYPKDQYCLETVCVDKYFCSQCKVDTQLNKHYLHSYLTLNSSDFQLREAQIVRELSKNSLNIHQQIKFNQFILNQVKEITVHQMEFDSYFPFDVVKQFIANQKQTLNELSGITNQYIQILTKSSNYCKLIKFMMQKKNQGIFIQYIKEQLDYIKQNQRNLLYLYIPLVTNHRIKFTKMIFKCDQIQRNGIDFNKNERMIKNKVYQIYKIHKSKLCYYTKSLKLQILTLFEASED